MGLGSVIGANSLEVLLIETAVEQTPVITGGALPFASLFDGLLRGD
jgi:hypothetical protein